MTLNCYKFEFSRNFEFRVISQIWEAATTKRMKIDLHCQRQNCSPLNLLFAYTTTQLVAISHIFSDDITTMTWTSRGPSATAELLVTIRLGQALGSYNVSVYVSSRTKCPTSRVSSRSRTCASRFSSIVSVCKVKDMALLVNQALWQPNPLDLCVYYVPKLVVVTCVIFYTLRCSVYMVLIKHVVITLVISWIFPFVTFSVFVATPTVCPTNRKLTKKK